MNVNTPHPDDVSETTFPDLGPKNVSHLGPANVSQRDAIHNVVDTVANDFAKGVKAARDALDEIEQQYLESAARAKGALNDHVEVCSKLNGEVARWRETIATIKQKMDD